MLTVLLLLSKYKMKSVPVVDLGGAKIDNIITQSAVIHMLAECVELRWFKNWGNKMLSELGLPVMNCKQIIEVYQDEPVLQAFKLMRLKGVGGVPVVERDGRKAVGNISIRDVQFLLTAPDIYKDYRSVTPLRPRSPSPASTSSDSGLVLFRLRLRSPPSSGIVLLRLQLHLPPSPASFSSFLRRMRDANNFGCW